MNQDFEFPPGTMHLRSFRLRDQLFKRVIIRRKGKASAIRSLMISMPGRKFVLVGDSGEKDAKIYRKICRQFPERVKGVFIREVPGHRLKKERFEKLAAAIPNGICELYTSAEELKQLASQVFESVE